MTDEEPLPLVRTRSPVLISFPWISGALAASSNLRTLATSDHCSSDFLNHLQNFEENSLLQADNVDGKRYRHLLRLEFTEGPQRELQAKGDRNRNPQEWNELSSIIAAYRLADIVALLETKGRTPPTRMDSRPKTGPARPLPSFVKLGDWTKLLGKFKTALQSKSDMRLSGGAESVQIKLLKSVVQCSRDGDINRVASNIFAASLHLSYLLGHPFEPHQLPELTESLQELTRIQISHHQADVQSVELLKLTPSEISFWLETFTGEDDNSNVKGSSGFQRQPLHAALIISPLYLLVPIHMLQKPFGKENLLCTSIALGNQRPRALLLVEQAIWRVLFRLALGQIEPGTALKTLVDAIPWSEVDSCSVEDRKWFKIAETTDRAAKTNSLSHYRSSHSAISNPSGFSDGEHQAQDAGSQSSTVENNVPTLAKSAERAHWEMDMDLDGDSEHNSLLISTAASVTQAAVSLTPLSQSTNVFHAVGVLGTELGAHEEQNPFFTHSLSSLSQVPLPVQLLLPDAGAAASAGVFPAQGVFGADMAEVVEQHSKVISASSGVQHHDSPLPLSNSCVGVHRVIGAAEPVQDVTRDGLRNPLILYEQATPLATGASTVEEEDNATMDDENEIEDERGKIETALPQGAKMPSLRVLKPHQGLDDHKSGEESIDREDEAPSLIRSNLRVTLRVGKPRKKSELPESEEESSGDEENAALVTSKAGSQKRKRSDSGPHDDAGLKQRKLTNSAFAAKAGQGTRDNPIKVEEYCLRAVKNHSRVISPASNLKPLLSSAIRRYTIENPLIVYDGQPVPQRHEIWPSIHDREELTRMVQLVRSTRSSNVDDKPLHVARPEQSVFRTFDFVEYSKLNHKDVEDILKTHCIVVTGMPWTDMAFDKDGLRTLAPLDAVFGLGTDLSQTYPKKDLTTRVVHGTIQQMLASAKSSGAGLLRKALNGLSFPFDVADVEKTTFAACRVAWSNTSRTVFKPDVRMPISHINWGLGATEGASTFWHLDSDGLATTVDVKTGSKIWIVGSDDPAKFSRLGLLLSHDFDLDQAPRNFKTEAILLQAKTRLIMRPGVVHAVYTPEDTICHGTHFYSTGSMQATLVSLIHGFICHTYITNISHPDTRVLLRRMMHFYHRGLVQGISFTDAELGHIPQIMVSNGEKAPNDDVLNFLSTCILAFFANVLDPRTYTPPAKQADDDDDDDYGDKETTMEKTISTSQRHLMQVCDANAIHSDEREEICETRGACIDAFAWFRTCFNVYKEGDSSSVDVISRYIVQLAHSILRYKHAAEVNLISAAGGCRLKDLEMQLENVLRLDPPSWERWISLHQHRWLDKEMSIKANVDVCSRARPTEHCHQDQRHSVRAEGLCIDVPNDDWEPSELPSQTHWRDESLHLNDRHLYQFIRNTSSYTQSTAKWIDLGETEFDSGFRSAVDWLVDHEARSVRLKLGAHRR